MNFSLAGWVLAAVLACSTVARAEGDLPGSPVAVLEQPSAATLPTAEAPAQREATTANAGGAVFSPFASPGLTTETSRQGQLRRDPAPAPPDATMTIVVTLASVAAAAWLVCLLVQT